MARKKGFTLIEIVITMVILGGMAAFAIPSYVSMVQNAGHQSAQTNLNYIYLAQKSYYYHHGSYCITACDKLADINTALSLNITDTANVYSCSCTYSSTCPVTASSTAYCYAQLANYPQTFLYETAGTPVYGMNSSSIASGSMSCGALAGSKGKAANACLNTAPYTCPVGVPGEISLGQTFDCVLCCGH